MKKIFISSERHDEFQLNFKKQLRKNYRRKRRCWVIVNIEKRIGKFMITQGYASFIY